MLTQFLTPYKVFFLNIYASLRNLIFFTYYGQRIFSDSADYREHEFVKRGEALKEHYANFLKNINLRKELTLVEYPHPMCFSVGYQLHFSKHSHAAIFMTKGLFDLDRDAFSFLLKHEASHIKHSDVLFRPIITLSVLTIATFFASYYYSFSNVLLTTFFLIPLLDYYLGGLWIRFCEWRADRFAMTHSSVDEIKGAVVYFSATKKYNASLAHIYPQFTKDGELAGAIHYPKTSKRIERFLDEIIKRTALIYKADEERVDRLVQLLKTNDEALKTMLSQQPVKK